MRKYLNNIVCDEILHQLWLETVLVVVVTLYPSVATATRHENPVVCHQDTVLPSTLNSVTI